MKILLATDTYTPDQNGPATLVQRLAVGLSVEHEVHVVYPASGWHRSSRLAAGGVVEHRLRSVPGPGHAQFRLCPPWGLEKHARSLLQSVEPDVVHVHTHLPLGRAVTAAARDAGIPVVATSHVTPGRAFDRLPVGSALRHRLARWARADAVRTLSAADVVTAPTPYAAGRLVAAGVRAPVLPISSGVDLTRFHPAADGDAFRRAHGLTSTPTLAHVGRLLPDKHIDQLIEAMAVLRTRWDAQLLIVGDGPERARLEALATACGVAGAVTFTGEVPDADLPGAYAAADLFCIGGTGELQSTVTLEAMASGLPIVAVDADALPHLVHHGENGLLFRHGDVQDLATRVTCLLDDPATTRRMGRRSRALASQHDSTVTLTAFLGLYGARQLSSTPVTGRPVALLAVK